MAIPRIKSTYSLDVETVRTLESLARRWNVSKTEVVRRAIQAAAHEESPRAREKLEALDRWQEALKAAVDTGSEPVPLHIRNAPTPEMKAWGYGRGYRYDPEEPGGLAAQHYLPDALLGTQFYRPGSMGFEARIAERIAWWERRRGKVGPADASGDAPNASGSRHEPEGTG